MLDSASLVITALIVIIILQVVIIVKVNSLKKKKEDEIIQEKPAAAEQRDSRRPKEPDNRFARTPPHDHRMKTAPAPSQNVDQVERSLRDINLRLKNAEKDQEKERQRIKDTLSPSSSSPSSSSPRRFDNQRPRERDDRFRRNDRNDRQRNDFQKNRSSNNPRGFRDERPASRNNYEARENMPSSGSQNGPVAPAAPPAAFVPEVSAPTSMPIAAPVSVPVSVPMAEKPLEQVFEAAATLPDSGANLQHGRKGTVKRRVLLGEENAVASEGGDEVVKDAGVNPAPVSSEMQIPRQASPAQEQKPEAVKENVAEASRPENEPYASGPISFGR